jgi:putative transposase
MFSTRLQRTYPSDLTDAQWELLVPLIPPLSPEAAYHFHERREIVNGILYVLRSGCPWRSLPHDLPAWGTVYHYFRKWQREGVWDRVLEALRMQMRIKEGRDPEPSAAVMTVNRSKPARFVVQRRATMRGKKIWGRKRHALVDSQGHLLEVKVTGADSSDQQGGKMLLLPLKEKFPRMKLLWGDSHYGGTMITWLKIHLGWTMQTVRALTVPKRGVLVPEGTEVDWEKLFPSGFRPLPRRWVIERSFAWMVRWRRLCRDHEGLPERSEAFIKLSASSRLLTRLAPPFPS